MWPRGLYVETFYVEYCIALCPNVFFFFLFCFFFFFVFCFFQSCLALGSARLEKTAGLYAAHVLDF